MKKILGSLLLLLLTQLAAEEAYFFKAKVFKSELFEREAAILEVRFYKKRSINTVRGKFLPREPEGVRLEEFQLESGIEGDYAVEKFIYLVSFEKAGNFTLPLFGEVQKFNEQDIVESNNHRDAMMAIATDRQRVAIDTVRFVVRPAAESLPVGAFVLSMTPDETQVLQNEPAHFSLTLSGEGDIDPLPFPEVAIEGAGVFLQEGERTRWLENGRLMGRKVNHYAVVSPKSFELPVLTAAYFSPKAEKKLLSQTQRYGVEVREDTAFASAALVDTPDKEKERLFSSVTADELMLWGLYGLFFICGFLAAKIKIPFRDREGTSSLEKSIGKTKEPKELLKLMLPFIREERFKGVIGELEGKKVDKTAFARIKKDVAKMLKNGR